MPIYNILLHSILSQGLDVVNLNQKLLVDAAISDSDNNKSYLFDSFGRQDDGVVVSDTYAILYPDADTTELLGPTFVIWYVDTPLNPRQHPFVNVFCFGTGKTYGSMVIHWPLRNISCLE